ncbi:hypothetical protein JCM19236_4598 [Vibrio sp. JCM 19236]|nr:hypothetical protein JCM19236_4598 [Vibrio sp. JCM 19236]
MKSIITIAAITALFSSSLFACVMDGVGTGALYTVPKQTFSVQLATHKALKQQKFSAAQGARYDQKMMMLVYQLKQRMQGKLNPAIQGSWYLFETSEGHYLRLDINEGKLDIKQHEVPAGDVEDAILIDVDALAAILQNQINLEQAKQLGVIHLPQGIEGLLQS